MYGLLLFSTAVCGPDGFEVLHDITLATSLLRRDMLLRYNHRRVNGAAPAWRGATRGSVLRLKSFSYVRGPVRSPTLAVCVYMHLPLCFTSAYARHVGGDLRFGHGRPWASYYLSG